MIFQNEKSPAQATNTRSSKSYKIDILIPKGLTHGFVPKMATFSSFFSQAIQARKTSFMIFQNEKKPFFNFSFQAIQPGKMSFMIFQNEKTPFQAIKTRTSKSQKIEIFPKGLEYGFGPKRAIFPTFFFCGNIGQVNVFYDILE